MLLLMLRIVVFLFISFQQASGECGRGWMEFGRSCYRLGESPRTWYDGEADCVRNGAHLTSVHDSDENQFLLKKLNLRVTWIGLHRMYNWSWLDDSAFDADKFSLDAPRGDGLFYAIDQNGDWYNFIDKPLRYICEAKTDMNATCGDGWELYSNQSCVYFSEKSLNWNDAEVDCATNKSQLVCINNKKELRFVQDLLRRRSEKNEYVWIGLYDAVRFSWTDNSNFIFTDFPPTPSKAAHLFCVQIRPNSEWNGDYCFNKSRFICKKNSSSDGGCDDGWIRLGRKCYYLSTSSLSWYEAERWCQENSSQLASVNDEHENNFIKDSITRRDSGTRFTGNYWIGINLWRSNSKWTDDSEHNYDNFGRAKPSGYGYIISSGPSSSWSDRGWNSYSHYVCKKSKDYCPEEVLPFPADPEILVKFPRTKYGRSATSVERCAHRDVFYGIRFCDGKKLRWEDAIWMTSCDASLKDVTNVTESNIGAIAADLVIMTSQPDILTSADVELSLDIVENGLKLFTNSNQNITNLYVECISNLIKATAKMDFATETSQRILLVLDEIASSVDVKTSSFMRTSEQLAVYVATAPSEDSSVGLEYQQVGEEDEGFESNQLRIFNKKSALQSNNSFIYINFNSSTSSDERFSFYAFVDDSVFSKRNDLVCSGPSTTHHEVNSQVILAATISQGVQLNNVHMRFHINQIGETPHVGTSKCGYWDEVGLDWMEFEAKNISEDFIECQIEHLTNFASLFSYTTDHEDNIGLTVLTFLGCTISIICQIVTLVLYFKPKASLSAANYTKARGVFLCNLAFALLLFNITIIMSEISAIKQSLMTCKIVAIILHFALLCVFTWMSVDTINIFVGSNYPFFYRVQREKISHSAFAVGWGVPLCLITIFVAIDNDVYGGENCWIVTSRIMYYVIIPTSILLATNFILFLFIFYAVKVKTRPVTSQHTTREERWKTVSFAFLLYFIIGGTWIFGFCISPFTQVSGTLGLAVAYIFTIFNSLQGAALFALYYVRSVEQKKKKNSSSAVRYTAATRLKESNQIDCTN